MPNDESEYILGYSDHEVRRLAYQHEIWLNESFALLEEAGVGCGQTVADLGCGPGFGTTGLSQLVGNEGKVFAIDASEKFAKILQKKINTLGLKNIVFYKDDASQLSLSNHCCHSVFARWVFCFLPDVEKTLRETCRILKPGGTLIILDYFNYLSANVFPVNHSIHRLFEAYLQSVEQYGGSYNIGNQLPALIADNGFEIQSLRPICRIARPGSRVWKWIEIFSDAHVPKLLEQGVWTQKQCDDFFEEWSSCAKSKGSFLFTPPMIGIIAKKLVA